MAEKDQKPTPKKLRDARKRGEVVFSSDVSGTVCFVAVVIMMWTLGGTALSMLNELWRHATSAELLARPDDRFPELLRHTAEVTLWTVVTVMSVATLAAFAGSFAQVGGLVAWERIKPDVNRLNPAEGFKRIFSTRNLVNLLKMVVKTLLLAALMFVVIRSYLDGALKLGHAQPASILAAGARMVLTVFAWAAVIYAAMAIIDYAHEHHEFIKQQRMSIEDIRREHKETEGDPVNQSRRRSAHFEAVYLSLADRVRMASAVIHAGSTAVALQYLGEKDLPRVIAKGDGELGAQILRVARDALIPMEEDAALAGRLLADVPLDQPIPRSLYEPVAKLLRWATGHDT